MELGCLLCNRESLFLLVFVRIPTWLSRCVCLGEKGSCVCSVCALETCRYNRHEQCVNVWEASINVTTVL